MTTPVVCCGFECAVITGAGGHLVVGIGTPTFDTTTFRTGLRSLRCNASGTAVELDVPLPASDVLVARVYIRFASLPNADTVLIQFSNSSQGTIFFQSSDSKIYCKAAATLGATGIAVTTGIWYRIDLKIDTVNDTVDAQIDGTALGQAAAAITSANNTMSLGVVTTAVTADINWDDLIVSVTAVDYPIGAGFVKSYIPNADGSHNVAGANDFEKTLTGTDITNATTDAWQLVDERPLPTTAVDFINGVAPPNSTDYVEIAYEDSAESAAPRAVEAVVVYHDASGAGTNNFSVTLRDSAGATTADIMAAATRNVGATISYARAHFATIPGGGAWTLTAFNALRSRFLVSDASPDPYIDALMIEAEYAETGGTPVSANFILNLEALQSIVNLEVLNIEALQSIVSTQSLDLESLQAVSTTIQTLIESFIGVSALHAMYVEALQAISSASSLNIESLTTVQQTLQVNLEALQSIVNLEVLNIEALQRLEKINALSIEALQQLSTTSVLSLESLKALVSSYVLSLESLKALVSSYTVNEESLAGVIVLTTAQLEALQDVIAPFQVNIESIGFATVTTNFAIYIEALQGLNVPRALPIEALTFLKADMQLNLESFVGVGQVFIVPIEAFQGILGTFGIPFEILGIPPAPGDISTIVFLIRGPTDELVFPITGPTTIIHLKK